jgi:ATP-binding cassette subfamily B protein
VFPVVTLITTTFLFTRVYKQLFIRNQENLPLERETGYIKRVFYLREYTKSLRLSEIKNVLIRNFDDSTEKSGSLFTKYASKIIPINFLLTVVFELFNKFGLLVYLFWRAFSKIISIGDFFGLYSAADNLLSSLQGVFQITNRFYENSLYIEKFRKFYDINNCSETQGDVKLDLFVEQDYNISFDNVYFKYNFDNKYALKRINFECKNGEKIAIVGHNGTGKTTLINLLLKLYHTTDGSIYINGINIDNFDFNSYRNNFNVISQDFNVFAASIAENVSLDLIDEYNCEDVYTALNIVGLYDIVSKMEKGIHTMLTKEFDSNGAVLSGGEQQKLALARLFLRNSPILILDEPSSALDPLSEYKIFKHIFEKYKDNTIFFVSHRLYTATLSDKIIVMDNGEIVEIGAHNQLLKNNGKYAELYNAATENYKIEQDRQ